MIPLLFAAALVGAYLLGYIQGKEVARQNANTSTEPEVVLRRTVYHWDDPSDYQQDD